MPSADGLILALDQGGHASRALVFDRQGGVRARAEVAVAVRTPGPGTVEHDADELAESLGQAAAAAARELGASSAQLESAALACQRSTIVCWDRESGAALSPAISWQDRRAAAALEPLAARAAEIRRRTGLRLSPHYGASKLRWCLDHLPAVAHAAEIGRLAMGPLASFLLFRLLRERPLLADPANAARTLLWNLTTLDWDPELLALFGVPSAALPRCVATCHAFGTLAIDDRALPLVVSQGDQQAALYARGAPPAGAALVNLGTGAFVLYPVPRLPDGDSPLLASVACHCGAPAEWLVEGTVNGAGSALAWFARETGLEGIEARLGQWLAETADPPLFLNGIAGLGSPWWRADFRSRFAFAAPPRAQAVAVAESIVFLVQANLDRMVADGAAVERLTVTGGLAALDGLCQRLADLAGRPALRPAETEATARGLAWLAAGRPPAWPDRAPPKVFEPRPNAALRERYARWREAMEAAVTSGS